jgi:hypothetical protein
MDIRRIEGKMISGLDDEEVKYLTHLLATAQSDDILNQWTGLPKDLVIDGGCVGKHLVHCKYIIHDNYFYTILKLNSVYF